MAELGGYLGAFYGTRLHSLFVAGAGDGSGLQVLDTAALNFGNLQDFTIEFWAQIGAGAPGGRRRGGVGHRRGRRPRGPSKRTKRQTKGGRGGQQGLVNQPTRQAVGAPPLATSGHDLLSRTANRASIPPVHPRTDRLHPRIGERIAPPPDSPRGRIAVHRNDPANRIGISIRAVPLSIGNMHGLKGCVQRAMHG